MCKSNIKIFFHYYKFQSLSALHNNLEHTADGPFSVPPAATTTLMHVKNVKHSHVHEICLMNVNIDCFVKATVIFLKSCFQLSIMVIIYSLNIEPFREIKSADGEAVEQSEEKKQKEKTHGWNQRTAYFKCNFPNYARTYNRSVVINFKMTIDLLKEKRKTIPASNFSWLHSPLKITRYPLNGSTGWTFMTINISRTHLNVFSG